LDFAGLLAQLLNGIQYGLLLFLISSGLTLIFGIMGIINLAHGSLFMIGAYAAYLLSAAFGSLWLALPCGVLGGAVLGVALERGLFRHFYRRDHLYQVLLTFALILLFEELRAAVAGNGFHSVPVPAVLDFSVAVTPQFSYSAYRLAVLGLCLFIAAMMFLLINGTRFGAMVRAAAEKPEMVGILGIDARSVHVAVFAIGTGLAVIAGMLAAPLTSVYPNMGDGYLIVGFVVVVVGGIGSIAGAFWAALLIGLVDALGQALVPSLSGMAIYVLMAAVLLWRPSGLFAKRA
jgi:branched-chain amino acid transport system permease protein